MPFAKKVVLSPLNGFVTLVKNYLTIYTKVYCQAQNSILLVYRSISIPVSHRFGYYGLAVSFGNRKCGTGSLEIPYDFQNRFFYFFRKCIMTLIEIALNLQITLGSAEILTILNLPNIRSVNQDNFTSVFSKDNLDFLKFLFLA